MFWRRIIRIASLFPFSSKRLESFFSSRLRQSMIYVGPEFYSRVFMIVLTLSLIASSFLFFFVGLLCLITLFLPASLALFPSFVSRSIRKRAESEFPFFLVLAYSRSFIQSRVIEHSLETVRNAGSSLFSGMLKLAESFFRNVSYSTEKTVDVLRRTFYTIGSKRLNSFMDGYVYTFSSGGSIVSYIKNELQREVDSLTESWRAFSTNISSMVEATLIVTGILPSGMQVLVSVFQASSSFIVYFTVAILVATCAIACIVCDSYQPVILDFPYSVKRTALFTSLLSSLFVLYYYQLINSVLLGLILTLSSTLYSYFSLRYLKGIWDGEREASSLLHTISEDARAGVPLVNSLEKAKKENYKQIKKLVFQFKYYISSGMQPTAASRKIKHDSWFVRFSFYLIAYMFEVGAGYEQMDTVSNTLKRIIESRRSVRNSTIPFLIISIGIPAMSFFSIVFLNSMGSVYGIKTAEVTRQLIFLVYLSSFLTGIVSSKFSSLSLRSMYFLPFVFGSTLLSSLLLGMS